jgi:squalene-associated FAD-dependent desaturase
MKPHCIIIGAGFAGSAAAVRLTEAGWRVTLMDARGAAGGRVYSFEDKETGEIIDNGQHLLMGCYHATLRLLDVLGTRHLLRPQEAMRVEFIEPASEILLQPRRAVLDAGRLSGKAGMALGIAGLEGLSAYDRWAVLRFAAALQLGVAQHRLATPLATQTALELLRSYGQTDALITRLWEPVILATLNAHPAEAAASLLVKVLERAFFSDRDSSRLLLPRVGLDDVLKPLAAWLGRRGSNFLRGTVASIHIQHHDSSFLASSITTNTGEIIEADCVISAVPPHVLTKLLISSLSDTFRNDEAFSTLLASLSQFTFSPIISTYLWFDRSFMTSEFVALLGTQTQWVFNRRLICDAPKQVTERFSGHISTTVSAGGDIINAANDDILRICLRDIHAAFPASRTAQMLRGRVIKEKFATPRITPAIEAIRPSATTPIANLFLAGDWTNTGLPATIESASQSGEAAAGAVKSAWNRFEAIQQESHI